MLAAVSYPAFLISVVLGFVGSVALFPQALLIWRPEWIGLLVFYWVFRAPHHFGIFFAAWMGLILDVIESAALGTNMLAMAVVAFLVLTTHQRLRMFPLPQQCLMVFLLLGINQMLVHFTKQVLGDDQSGFSYLCPALTSALAWPLVSIFLDALNRKLR